MGNNTSQLTGFLNIILIAMIAILVILVIILIVIKVREKAKGEESKNNNTSKNPDNKPIGESYQKESIYDFMEFDAIEDNMILKKDRTRFIMVIKCTGSNFDLASEDEKLAIESGFIKFLNSLKFPIQIYIQARKFNIDNSILEYKEKLKKLAVEAERAKSNYEFVRRTPNVSENELKNAYMEAKRMSNVYEYARDVVLNTERVKTNKNILKKEHYIVITYSPLEDLTSTDMYDKEELKEKAFSELYIRCQSLIRVLNACDVNGKILNSIELAELLYVAYNREQYEIYGIDKVLNSQYNQLYVTAEDVLDKKMKRLDEKIEIDAINHATEILTKVKNEKEKELQDRKDNINKMVRKMTEVILEQNKNRIEEDVFEKAKQILEEENTREEEEKNEKEKAKKVKRKRTTGSNI